MLLSVVEILSKWNGKENAVEDKKRSFFFFFFFFFESY